MIMVHGNTVFIKEDAKLAKNTRNLICLNLVNFPGALNKLQRGLRDDDVT